jgi:hypothetical protein
VRREEENQERTKDKNGLLDRNARSKGSETENSMTNTKEKSKKCRSDGGNSAVRFLTESIRKDSIKSFHDRSTDKEKKMRTG